MINVFALFIFVLHWDFDNGCFYCFVFFSFIIFSVKMSKYQVKVFTSERALPASFNQVFIKLVGENGESSHTMLKNLLQPLPFLQGSVSFISLIILKFTFCFVWNYVYVGTTTVNLGNPHTSQTVTSTTFKLGGQVNLIIFCKLCLSVLLFVHWSHSICQELQKPSGI